MPVAETCVRSFVLIRAKQIDQLFFRLTFNTNPCTEVCKHSASGVSPMIDGFPFLRVEGARKRFGIGSSAKIQHGQ